MDDVGAEQPGVIATPGHRRLTVAGADRPVGVHLWPAARPAPGDPLIMAFHGWTDGGAVFTVTFPLP